jgi:uncharacterized repeat protein (TIGR03803 family)
MLCAYIYQINPAGGMTQFYAFESLPTSASLNATNRDGLWPSALIVGTDGNLYGACRYNGPGGGGTIFKIDLAGNYTLLKSFKLGGNTVDPGYLPLSLVEGADGSLYETNGVGIYQLAPDGSFNELYVFKADPVLFTLSLGGNPSSIMQASDGNFYLTLQTGPQVAPGTGTMGSIARFNPITGQLNTYHAFLDNGSEGAVPIGPLVEGSDGYLYGLTSNRTTYPIRAYKIAPNGELDLLHTFTGGADGGVPKSPLFVGSDGNFYGVTYFGGDTTSTACAPTGCGTEYQITPGGVLTTLHAFEGGTPTSTVVAENPNVDGAVPEAPLVQANDGSFYGTSLFNVIYKTTMNPAIPAPLQMTLKPTVVAAGKPTTVTWKVLNAFSQTAQVCGASIVGNKTGAGTWSGILSGTVSNGVYGGTATITPTEGGTYVYAISCGGNETALATLLVTSTTALQMAPPGPVNAAVNQPYQLVLTVTGGQTPYAFSFSGTVPKGLTWDPAGAMTGTPLQFGDYSLGFAVQDSSKPPENDAKQINLHIISGLTLQPTLATPQVGKYYVGNLATTGGITPYTWTLTAGTLPPGLTLNSSAGQITGTPTKPGPSTFNITVKDSEGIPDQVTTTFKVNTGTLPLAIPLNTPLTPASVGVPYTYAMSAIGGVQPYFWSILPSAPPTAIDPPGLTISQDGVISGTPNQYSLGYDNFFIQVTDSDTPPQTAKDFASIIVNRTLKITGPTSLPTGVVGVAQDVPLTASGGVPPYTWVAKAFPDPNVVGLYIDANVLEYQPIVSTTGDISIYLADSEATPDAAQSSLPFVFLPAPLVTSTTLTSSNMVAGTGQTVTLTARVSLSAGGAPPGQVIFYNGTASLGVGTLDATGTVTLQTSFAANGVYSLTAAYGGNQSFAASTSAVLSETVVTPTVTAAASPITLTLTAGSSGHLVITVTPVGGFTGTVNFSCGTLPANVACYFQPQSLVIAGNSGPLTEILTVTTGPPVTLTAAKPMGGGSGGSLLLAASIWMPGSMALLWGMVRRKPRRTGGGAFRLCVIAIVSLAGALAMTSCGVTSRIAARGTYRIPISITIPGATAQSLDVTVVVQ